MANNLYIIQTEERSGKSVISLGLMDALLKDFDKVAFFRPIIKSDPQKEVDPDIDLILTHNQLKIPYEDTYAYTYLEAKELINAQKQEALLDGILNKFKELENKYDFILCSGSDFEGASFGFEFELNIDIANNLGSHVLGIINGSDKSHSEIISTAKMSVESFEKKGANLHTLIVNQVDSKINSGVIAELNTEFKNKQFLHYVIPEEPMLKKITIGEIVKWFDAEVLYGEDMMDQYVSSNGIGAMQICNFLNYLKEDRLMIVPGDRADIILTSIMVRASSTVPKIAGLLLTGGLKPDKNLFDLIKGFQKISMPIISVKENTYVISQLISKIYPKIAANDKRKIVTALGLFESSVNSDELLKKLEASRSNIVTPMMFEHSLIQRAKSQKKHIVLPEGTELRILKAAEVLTLRNMVDITLLGNEEDIRGKIKEKGLNLSGVNIIQPEKFPKLDEYIQTYYELRKKKGVTLDTARDAMLDNTYFGTMMVYKGDADGMVSGAVHTTRQTIRPSLEFIKTKPDYSIVSSVFLMCLKDRVIVYGDCAINPNPDAKQLAEIALSSAETAKAFGIDPKVAMLSYSTGDSGIGPEVEKVREATRIAKERNASIKLEGPIQYDAAIDPSVAKTKMPNSEVAGQATVFIFPDLNTGNNTYKAVQRAAGAVAIGPVLQGLNKPVNDLSRGCNISDIIYTVAITAIQAQN